MPPAATKLKDGKNLLVLHFDPTPTPHGCGMSVKCEQSIDELTVQVWLLYHHPNFKYCTLFVSGTALWTNRRTDNSITRCPRRTFQAGGIKIYRALTAHHGSAVLPIANRLDMPPKTSFWDIKVRYVEDS